MGDVYASERAADALGRLEADAGRRQLWGRVDHILELLESNPGDQSARQRRFTQVELAVEAESGTPSSGEIWAVTVHGSDEDWLLLWEPHPDQPDDIWLHYAGPTDSL